MSERIKQYDVLIDDDGNIKFIYTDDLEFLKREGHSTTVRASHVEPQSDKWIADMSPVRDGLVLGPFDYRQQALDAEVAWLKQNWR